MTRNPQDPIREFPITEIIPHGSTSETAHFRVPQLHPNVTQKGRPG